MGIWPYKPQVILDLIAPPRPETPLEVPFDLISTPYTTKRIRQFTKTYTKNPIKEAFRKLTKANETNAAKASIAEHCAEGLKEALLIEKKKRRRGKKLNLTGEPSGKAQFFGTAEVLATIARENGKAIKAEQDKLDKQKVKEDAKITKAIENALKKQEKELEELRKAEEKEVTN
jgi:dipeptidase